ncbi:hypothetical protein Droror1_Dr00001279 [Drosera rotundifolia]
MDLAKRLYESLKNTIKTRMADLVSKHKELISEMDNLGLWRGDPDPLVAKRESTTSSTDPAMWGRAREKDEIKDALLGCVRDDAGNFAARKKDGAADRVDGSLEVIVIVGMAGVGKTKMAQWAYNEYLEKFHYGSWV